MKKALVVTQKRLRNKEAENECQKSENGGYGGNPENLRMCPGIKDGVPHQD